jgi:hypothetical protein
MTELTAELLANLSLSTLESMEHDLELNDEPSHGDEIDKALKIIRATIMDRITGKTT